jgi:hypothetical protein
VHVTFFAAVKLIQLESLYTSYKSIFKFGALILMNIHVSVLAALSSYANYEKQLKVKQLPLLKLSFCVQLISATNSGQDMMFVYFKRSSHQIKSA